VSVTAKAFKGGLWLAGFSVVSQTISWLVTIFVARILAPDDYAMMEMAIILTGFVQIFEELGIGAAVIQREKVTEDELSSLFWCLVLWGSVLALVCLGLAYPTVAIYNEPRIFHLTQAVAVLFLIGPVTIVPRHLLQRELRFKAVGFTQSASVVLSCLGMLIMAHMGAGVWTLLGGNVIRQFSQMVLVFAASRWKPRLCFDHRKAAPYIRFGLPVVGGASLHYIYSRADIFFGGRSFSTNILGFYTLSQRLAEIPNSRILSLVHAVSYPVFARYQTDMDEFRNFFLKLFKVIGLFVLPLYVCGILLAHELIVVVLGDKWIPSVLPFQLLCLCHLAVSLTASSSLTVTALGKPNLNFYFNAAAVPVMVTAFATAAHSGAPEQRIALLTIPWAVCFPLMRLAFFAYTVRIVGLNLTQVVQTLVSPLIATSVLAAALLAFHRVFFAAQEATTATMTVFLIAAITGTLLYYTAYIMRYERSIVQSMWRMIRSNNS